MARERHKALDQRCSPMDHPYPVKETIINFRSKCKKNTKDISRVIQGEATAEFNINFDVCSDEKREERKKNQSNRWGRRRRISLVPEGACQISALNVDLTSS